MGKNIEEVAAHYIIPTCSSEPTLSQEASLSHSPSLYLSLNTSLSSFPLSLPLHSTVPFSFSTFLLPPSFPPPFRCLVFVSPYFPSFPCSALFPLPLPSMSTSISIAYFLIGLLVHLSFLIFIRSCVFSAADKQ